MNTLHTSHIFIFIFDHMQICSNCMLIARGQNKSLRPKCELWPGSREKKRYSLLWKLCRFHILVFIKNYLSNQCNAVYRTN